MSAVFGLPTAECLIASPMDGVSAIMPTDWQVSYSNTSYAEVSIRGILMDQRFRDKGRTVLKSVSMIELLAEVDRRIKDGENITTHTKEGETK